MKYLSLDLSILRHPAYVGSEPVERATWFNLLAYCCDQENGGEIVNCGSWKCRQWQQTCGVMLQEVKSPSQLWTWANDSLTVYGYPHAVQTSLEAKRSAGQRGGRASGEARREAMVKATPEQSLNVSKVSKVSNVSDVSEGSLTPTREQFLSAANLAGVESHIAEIWFDEAESRAFSPEGHWTSKSGQPIVNWRSALKAYAGKWQANASNSQKSPSKASGGRVSVWEAKQKIEVLQGQIRRIEANPDNKVGSETSFERVLRPEKKAEIKSIKVKIRELEALIAA